jgi:hypothetical protein
MRIFEFINAVTVDSHPQVFRLRYGSACDYLIICQSEHVAWIEEKIKEFKKSPWMNHFNVYRCDINDKEQLETGGNKI